MKKVAIIGGGASGIFGAIRLKQLFNNNIDITIYEKNNKIGRKILASGNGKCNISNESLLESNIYNNELGLKIYNKFTPLDLRGYLDSLGIITKTDLMNRIYPNTEAASSVIDILLMHLKQKNVTIYTNELVTKIEKNDNNYLITSLSYKKKYDYVIISTGSKASGKLGSNNEGYDLLKGLNINISELKPGLVGLKTNKKDIISLSGIRQKSCVKLFDNDKLIFEELGEVQFKDEGISGIVVMNASSILARYNKPLKLVLDFLPGFTKEELIEKLEFITKNNPDLSFKDLTHGILPKMLANKICDKLHNLLNINTFIDMAKNYQIDILDNYGFDSAQICIGGIEIDELNDNLELVKYPNMYATGEIINVDGLCGGYNLHFAIASAQIVASSIFNKEGK